MGRILGVASKPIGRLWQAGRTAHAIYVLSNARRNYEIHPTVKFHGDNRVYGGGGVAIAADSYLNVGARLVAGKGTTLRIGRGVRIGQFVRIETVTADADADASRRPLPQVTGDVVIGDWAWIGIGAYIGPGITIGENAVVGANSVVTRDVEPFEIVGGVPARHIRFKSHRRQAT